MGRGKTRGTRPNNRSKSSDQLNEKRRAIPPGMFPEKPPRESAGENPPKNGPPSPINDKPTTEKPSEKPSGSDK